MKFRYTVGALVLTFALASNFAVSRLSKNTDLTKIHNQANINARVVPSDFDKANIYMKNKNIVIKRFYYYPNSKFEITCFIDSNLNGKCQYSYWSGKSLIADSKLTLRFTFNIEKYQVENVENLRNGVVK